MRMWIVTLALLLVPTAAWAGSTDKRLDIYWVDVEGGAATLLVTPRGESILIDTGNPGRRDAERIVQAATRLAGLSKINHLITTHYHGDHFGGAAVLAELIPIEHVYDNGEFEGQTERPSKPYREFKCASRTQIEPGQTLKLLQLEDKGAPQVKFTFIGGRQKFIAAPAGAATNDTVCAAARSKDRDGSDNANSIVMLVEFGGWKFFDAGDLTWNVEKTLVCPHNLIGPVDVYQVTHHGLDASNNPLVLKSLLPKVAVMNNGTTKGCLPEVFANLKETPSIEAIYQVHKNLRPDGATNNTADEYIANAAKECKGDHIKLSVAPDAKSYTVAIPANKHEKTYLTK